MSNDTSTKKVNGFCGGIQVLFHKAQEICNSDQVISSAEQLEELEQTVCNLSDQLQAIIIEERLQSSFDFSLQKIPVGGGLYAALQMDSGGVKPPLRIIVAWKQINVTK